MKAEDIYTALARRSYNDVRAFFALHDGHLLRIAAPPRMGDLPNSRFRRFWTLCGCWNKGAVAPLRDISIIPTQLAEFMDHLIIFENVEPSGDARFKYYGSNIAKLYGRDMTGQKLSDIDSGGYIQEFFRATMLFCTIEGLPIFSSHAPAHAAYVTRWNRLAIPVATQPGKAPDTVFVLNDARRRLRNSNTD